MQYTLIITSIVFTLLASLGDTVYMYTHTQEVSIQILVCRRTIKSQLLADDRGAVVIPRVITDSTPLVVKAHLHSTSSPTNAAIRVDESNLTGLAHLLRSISYIIL